MKLQTLPLPRHATGLLASLLLLAGCSVAPAYDKPGIATPAAFKEAAPVDANWKPAEPADSAARGEWWQVFGDPVLDRLEQDAIAANPDLLAAAARLGQARALEQSARAARFPQVGVGFGPTRQRPSPASQGLEADADTRATTLWRGQATIAYEVDLFGRLASAEEAARLDTERRAALFGATLLSLQADVAQAYFLIRELDAAQALYGNVVKLRADTVKLLQRRFEEGDIAELDLARARSELAAARSESLGLSRQRALAEHALAILLGKQPAEFSLPAMPLGRLSIDVPAGLPSALLERRPDIAAAERAMAAANARVGVARAAWFPRLSLTGALGYESDGLGDLFKYASRSFVFGPLVGTALSLPIFDGGAREASVNQARSAYVEDSARYRQTVLQAFREVEDNLAQLRILGEQHREQDSAVGSAERAARIARLQYREGAVSYLNVIDAERSVLQQQRLAVGLDGERARSTVNLIRALGGGWTAPSKAPAAG